MNSLVVSAQTFVEFIFVIISGLFSIFTLLATLKQIKHNSIDMKHLKTALRIAIILFLQSFLAVISGFFSFLSGLQEFEANYLFEMRGLFQALSKMVENNSVHVALFIIRIIADSLTTIFLLKDYRQTLFSFFAYAYRLSKSMIVKNSNSTVFSISKPNTGWPKNRTFKK